MFSKAFLFKAVKSRDLVNGLPTKYAKTKKKPRVLEWKQTPVNL